MNGKPTVYLETTIPSYLTSRPSNNLITAGEQQLTQQWWERRKNEYAVYISELVIEEAKRGDPIAVMRRLSVISEIDELEIDNESLILTKKLLRDGVIPPKAAADAGHIAIASRHGVDYLLTWNCTHIANAEITRRVSYVVREAGYYLPVICTPRELFGGTENE
jgi:hypothetical protein